MKPLRTPLAFLITLALWVLALPTIFAQEEDLNTLNQEISKLAGAGKFKEALPIAERAVEVSKRTHGLEDPTTANSLDNLGQLSWTSAISPKLNDSFSKPSLSRRKSSRQRIPKLA
jgi:hypothetical protein